MYSTKYKVHAKADQGQMSINATTKGGKKVDPKLNKNSRYEGKQFALPKPAVLFSTFTSTVPGKPDPYNERNVYRNKPKKHGFGSSDAPKRDEFSNTIAIEQYRETIAAVKKSASKAAKVNQRQAPVRDQDVPIEPEEAKMEEEVFEYDQAFSVNPDVVGKPRSRTSAINLGGLRTTNSTYGVKCGQPGGMEIHSRGNATKAFFNVNHLRVGDHDDHH